VATAIDNADSAEIPAAAVELGVGGMFSSLFPDGIALGAKVKAAVEVKAAVGRLLRSSLVFSRSMQLSRPTQLSRSTQLSSQFLVRSIVVNA
jgi:hypothetical protein